MLNWIIIQMTIKKPRHPVGVFRIGLLSMTPVLLHDPGALISYCYLEHPVLNEFMIGN